MRPLVSRFFNRRIIQCRVLLAFVGTIDPECIWTSIGDLMALYNVASSLIPHVKKLEIAWSGDLFDLSEYCVNPDFLVPEDYDAMIFVCGPLHEGIAPLFSRFSTIKRLAVGVSIPSSFDPSSLVDAVYVRDSETGSSFDLALANIGYPHLSASIKFREKRAGICLVGHQKEYGAHDGHVAARKLAESATNGYKTISVQTVLDLSRPIPASVELDLQCSTVLITTRMHGSLLAIYHGVPLIAIDQIKGSAKLTRMLSKIDYPAFNAWVAQPDEIRNEIDRLSHHASLDTLANAKKRLVNYSRSALSEAMDFILSELS